MEETKHCYFNALYRVAMTINSSLEPREVLQSIAQSTAAAMGAKGCAIMLLSPDRRELRHSAEVGLSDRYLRKGPVKVDLSMADALAGHSVSVKDAATDERLQYSAEAIQEGIASILSVPMKLRGDVIGVMRVYSAEARDFVADDVEFVEAVANLGALALENAHRLQDVKDDYDQVTRYLYSDTWVGHALTGEGH